MSDGLNQKVGDIVIIKIELDSAVACADRPCTQLRDKDVLSLLAVEEGGYFSRGGEKVRFTWAIEAADGVARADIRRGGELIADIETMHAIKKGQLRCSKGLVVSGRSMPVANVAADGCVFATGRQHLHHRCVCG